MDKTKLVFILGFFIFSLFASAFALPSITITSPLNTSYSTMNITFNATTSADVNWCNASIDGGNNQTLSFKNQYWTTNTSIISGLSIGTPLVYASPSVFTINNGWYAILGNNTGVFNGYSWTGTAWTANASVVTGLTDVGTGSNPSVFTINNGLYLISGSDAGTFSAFSFLGSSWVMNSSVNASLGDIGTDSDPSIFNWNNGLYMIAGENLGSFFGYSWTGTAWAYNSSVNASLSSIGFQSSPAVFYKNNYLYMIAGNATGSFTSFSFNRSNWVVNNSVNVGLTSTGNFATPATFNKDGVWYTIAGNQTGGILGFMWNYNWTTKINSISEGSHQAIFYCNDSIGIGSASVSFRVNTTLQNAIYTTPIQENEATIIKLNLKSTEYTLTSASATLYYDGTAYSVTANVSSTTTANFTTSITIPVVSSQTIKTFYWNITLNGGTSFLSSTYSQVIVPLSLTATSSTCPVGLNVTRYFTFANETDSLAILGLTANINIKYGTPANNTLKTYNISLTNTNNISICINLTAGNYSLGYGEIQYSKTNLASNRYYMFTSTNLTAVYEPTKLYSLAATDATSFSFTFQDTQLNYYVGYYGSLLRWYPAENQYRTTAMGKTDDIGQTIMYLETEDADYRIGLYNIDGTLINLASPVRFTCPVTPCQYTISVSPSGTLSYLDEWNMQKELTWNSTSKKFTFIWNDATGNTQSIRLKCLKIGGNADIVVYDGSSGGATGLTSCDCAGYTSGTFIAYAYRTASPETPIATATGEILGTRALQNSAGLLIAVFLIMTGALLGIWHPAATIIITIISLIPAYVFHIILLPVVLGFVILGVLALHMMKKVS